MLGPIWWATVWLFLFYRRKSEADWGEVPTNGAKESIESLAPIK